MVMGDDDSETASVLSSSSSRPHRNDLKGAAAHKKSARPIRLARVQDSQQLESGSQDLNGLDRNGSPLPAQFEAPFTFKVEDPDGNLHKVTSSADSFDKLVDILCERLKSTPTCLRLKYTDGDGDEVLVSDDSSLSEAVDHARSKGDNFSRLRAVIEGDSLVVTATSPTSILGLPLPERLSKAVTEAGAFNTGDAEMSEDSLSPLRLIGGASAAIGLLIAIFMVTRKEAPSTGGMFMRTYTR